ncbi:hypothetical protein [Dyella terrae]|nr:hypothetical protein [Dyella terrae]ULU25970.1 hypothetical protein DYST_02908 [Dyella terrae]
MTNYKAWWVAKGVARLVFVVLLSLLMAGLGYLAILAVIVHFPPHAIL